jgi:hypothetical protein
MAPEPLLVIDKPALAVHRHDRDVRARDQPVILQHFRAGHGVFLDALAAAHLGGHLPPARLQFRDLLGV